MVWAKVRFNDRCWLLKHGGLIFLLPGIEPQSSPKSFPGRTQTGGGPEASGSRFHCEQLVRITRRDTSLVPDLPEASELVQRFLFTYSSENRSRKLHGVMLDLIFYRQKLKTRSP